MKLIDKETLVAEIERRMDELYKILPDASKVENGAITISDAINTGKYTALESFGKFINSLEDSNAKKPTLVIRKGKKYMCIKDYHDKTCTFTKGKIYQSDKDFFLVDDEDKLTFERKIWEDDACEYFCNIIQEEPKKCMYAQPNYTNGDRLVLCKDCNELCKYNQKTAAERLGISQEVYDKIVNECIYGR